LKLGISEHEVAVLPLRHNFWFVAVVALTCTQEGDKENRKKYISNSFRIYTVHVILFDE
jgi:hypothetical protein